MRFGIAEDVGGAEILALALSERALLAMAPPVGPGRGLGRTGTYRVAPGRDRAKLRDAP